ncbi:MAG: serine/threonine-protein kinase [Aquabacterium sp.]|nr:serine/threonine-protein kinase [Aquabacterium sp.]
MNPEPVKTPPPRAPDSGNGLPIGHRLHEFEIEGLVGEGGFGIVYLARDTQLHRTVAIKEYMPASLAMRAGDLSVTVRSERHRETFTLGMRSFVNEARLLASFDHPALIKVYRFWEENGTAYMVMPYYQGPTLKTWLREQPKPPDEAWLKGVLAPLLDALEVIHSDHCYHRDIAPDNILLLGPNKPLLLDFGAARRVIGDATQALTVILKPGYAPVEQYAEVPSMKQGPWTDVYALCAVVYASIMGKAPPPSVGRMMKDELVPLVQAAAGRYSAAFLAAIDAGLTVHPDQRLHDVAALRARLFVPDDDSERTLILPAQPWQATQVVARPSTGTGTDAAVVTKPPVKRKLGWLVGGLSIVGLIGGGGVAWRLTRPVVNAPAAVSVTAASAVQAVPAEPVIPTLPATPATRDPFTIAAALEDIVRGADPLLAVNTLTDKSQLTIGKDKLLFKVRASTPGYLYVYLAGTDASHFYLLFPNALDNNNRIEADKLVELPRKGWHITAGGPPGVNHIVTIVSPFPRDLSNLGLNTKDSIPEFDIATATKMWADHKGSGSPFVGPAVCPGTAPCDQRYGASLVHIEELAR